MKRLLYLDSLKGIACLGVFIHHLFIIILPATYSGQSYDSVVPYDYLFGSSPIGFIINGNFYVCLFIALSSFLISRQTYCNLLDANRGISSVRKSFLKRYPRLMLPVLATNLICILFSLINKFCSNIDFDLLKISFPEMLKVTLIDMWFTDSVNLSGHWMLHIILIGSFISTIMSMILVNVINNSKKFIILFSVISIYLFIINTYFLAVSVGILVYFISLNIEHKNINYNNIIKFKILCCSLFVLYIIFAGYPSSLTEFGNFYFWANMLPATFKHSPQIFHTIGVFFLLLLVTISENLKNYLSHRILVFLGKISFAVYLIHPLVNHFYASNIYKYFSSFNTGLSIVITFITSMILVLMFSWLFYKYIERFCNYVTNKIVSYFS